MTHKTREIPWGRVVKFHTEITRRAEADFFAFPSKGLDSERWSPLKDFFPTSLSGPWTIPQESVVSQSLARLIRGGDLDVLFIGVPCWSTRRRTDQKKWAPYQQPVIYREVRVEIDPESRFRIIPEKGNWYSSLLVHEFMEQKGIRLENPLDELLSDILERAHSKSKAEGKDLIKCLIEELGRVIPELGYELNRFKSPPASNWVLFTPPTTSSPFTQHLMRDYEELTKQLESNPDRIGGLRLLEDLPAENVDEQVDILPIIPLNDSQYEAVTDALKSKPVTVISGPPGCGKSQVVISLLLNAWAKGTSVLFASNNNKAVDVVRERFERFENDFHFPIAVRAGSSKGGSIEETLRRILNAMVGAKSRGKDNSGTTAKRYEKLSWKRKFRQDCLENKIPQRVNEALRSALNAYGQYQVEVRKLKDAHELQVEEVSNLGYAINPYEFTARITNPLHNWLEKIEGCRKRIEQDSQDRSNFRTLAATSADARARVVQQAGLDPNDVTNWNWLVSGPGPELIESWLESYKLFLSQPIEQRLAPIDWQEVFEDWKGEEDARNWSQRGRQLAKDIKHTCGELSPKVAEIEDVKKRFDEQSHVIMEAGIPDDIHVDPDILSEWVVVYTTECSRPPRKFDWCPWSQRRKLVRKLQSIEAKILPAYPLLVLREVGEMNETARETLSEIIELTRNWIAVRNQWDENKTMRQEIDDRSGALRERATELPVDGIPDGTDLSVWLKLAETIEKKTVVADDAADAWNKKVTADEIRKHLRELVMEFQSIASGIPIKEAWMKDPGHEFTQSVSMLGTDPTQDRVVSARTSLYGESIAALLKVWHEARDAEQEFRAHNDDAAEIPSELSRIADWWDEKPSPISIHRADCSTLPDDGDELWKHLIACEERDEKWKSHIEKMLPNMEKQRDDELNWAIDRLKEAFEAVPDGPGKKRIDQTVKPLLDGHGGDWQTDKLVELFKSYDPNRIKGEISRIDAQLEILSSEMAKESWLRRVAGDAEAQDAVETLLNHYRRNYDRIDDSMYEVFSRALHAVPIWITTALSTKSIPMQPEVFDLLVIDEATQCTLTNLLPMIHRARRIVVIGDPEQLPAIGTIGQEAERSLVAKFDVTEWQELLGHAGNDVYKTAVKCMPWRRSDIIPLFEHYRSHPLIIGFANQHIYQKKLRLRRDPDQAKNVPYGAGVHGKHVKGYCKRGPRDRSWINPPEVDAVCERVKQLRECEDFGAFTIGVVTPFSAHAEAISEKLDEMGLLMRDVTVGTAHRYQGDERDIMIFSPVVAKGITDGAARWVEEPTNLINVALTRAREALFVVGDLEFCRQQPGILGKLVKYVETISDLRKTSPYELELFSLMVVEGWDPQVHVKLGDIEVDFVLTNPDRGIRLVVEVDGETVIKPDGEVIETHIEGSYKDESRDASLRGKSYKVLHFTTRSIREIPRDVLRKIAEALELDWDDDLLD
ncbi:MAG: AAA domain-containing protein [Euryarchaeota archaeon]|nr:AAA domain-containing protein [Euryarchaeota archaeon]